MMAKRLKSEELTAKLSAEEVRLYQYENFGKACLIRLRCR